MEISGYEITRCIGQGGMASAYLAKQTSLDRLVVLKVLDTATVGATQVVERFLNEGRIIASMNHPHVITIHDIGMTDSDVYIAMEFVEGGDLKERLKHQSFAPAETFDIITKIATGLEVAHKNGIVHRDVKPANILFRSDGTPVLSDFGIAKKITSDTDLTATGMFLGSPNYMSPEQAEAGSIDGRTDIYALGVILYEMLTGRKPYSSDSVIDVLLMHKKDPIPDLPVGLEQYQELINLMLAKDRNQRFRDMGSLLDYLAKLAARVKARSLSEMASDPDIDISGDYLGPPGGGVTRVSIGERKKVDRRNILLLVLVFVGIANLMLAYLNRQIDSPDLSAPQGSAGAIEEIPALEGDNPDLQAPQAADVTEAMRWLAQHSLNEYRLTAPPQDNAYYYFSRLLQINPSDRGGVEGLREVASRYAVLADREIANGNLEQARSYITVGLQVDPANKALQALDELAVAERNSFITTLKELF